jgi:hypothetical protein
MARGIIYYKGVFNVWSTVADAPIFVSGLTGGMLRRWIKEELGADGLAELPVRIEQAMKTGCDDMKLGHTLDDLIEVNRAGEHDSNMSKEAFLAKFFTVQH